MSISAWQQIEAKKRARAQAVAEALKALGLPDLEAIPTSSATEWMVRPAGQMGNGGWFPRPWTGKYYHGRTAEEAVEKAMATFWDKPLPPRKVRKA